MSEAGILKSIHSKHAVILRLHCQRQPDSCFETSETCHPITNLHIYVLDLFSCLFDFSIFTNTGHQLLPKGDIYATMPLYICLM